jgi:predicted secreted protein
MVQTFVDPTQSIRVAVGETFALALAGNPTTGYLWEASVDDQYLGLVFQEFEQGSRGVGAGGQEVFHFCALATGETEIDFTQRRPWGGEPRDTKHFCVVIAYRR